MGLIQMPQTTVSGLYVTEAYKGLYPKMYSNQGHLFILI